MAFCLVNGYLYENNKPIPMTIGVGLEMRIQGELESGSSGSFQVVGKLTANGTEEVLKLVSLGDYSTATTITTTDIYEGDVSGLYSISVKNVTGFTKIYATVIAY